MNWIRGLWAFSDTNSGERKKMELELTFSDEGDGIPYHISFQKRRICFRGREGAKTVVEIKKGNQVVSSGEMPRNLLQSLQYLLKTESF